LAVLASVILCGSAQSEIIFRDDFNDGSLNDPSTQSGSATPLSYISYGTVQEFSGILYVSPPGNPSGIVPNRSFTDASIPLNAVGAGFAVEALVSRVADSSEANLGMFKPNNTALVIDQGVFSFNRPNGADFGLNVYDPSPGS